MNFWRSVGLLFAIMIGATMVIRALVAALFGLTAARASHEPVTCGSLVKLVNARYSVRLHSPDVKYGTGSGQQSVTGVDSQIEVGSNWQVKGNDSWSCPRGKAVVCGQIVRLENADSRKNLHSHKYRSPITGGQEVSVYGDNGLGDSGDHWLVVCDDDFWYQGRDVMFRHDGTGQYLEATGQQYHDPISGQIEIACSRTSSVKSRWKTAEGVFIQHTEPASAVDPTTFRRQVHEEL